MKSLVYAAVALTSMSSYAFAEEVLPRIVLDKVSFQVSSKQWVSTQTALLTVNINATLSNADLVKMRADILGKLNNVAKGDWHITEFTRSQDNSGLEKLFVAAEARIDQAALTDIYKNAKSVSAPGATYEVASVEFKPSLEDLQAAKEKVRGDLYQKINDEIARINKVYSSQNFTVNNVVFFEGENGYPPRAYQVTTMNVAVGNKQAAAEPSVSNELVLTAMVEAASTRK